MPELRQSASSIDRGALLRFVLLCVAVTAGALGYALFLRSPRGVGLDWEVPVGAAAQLDEVRRGAHVLFRHTAPGPAYGRVAVAALDNADSRRIFTPLSCDRVYATRKAGLCLQASRGVFTTYQAVSFDGAFRELHSFNLPGAPSRTRVSPDGRLAAATVFVSGDSYASNGFSTRTMVFDLEGSTLAGDLETFAVRLDEKPFADPDFNFWGVTFVDSDRFFATLSSGGTLYLVGGQIADRIVRVLRTGVECPSLSPDRNRLVFKARVFDGARLLWRLRVLDLRTMQEREVNEQRTVDDQAEWLDDTRVLYALPGEEAGRSDVWVANADGTGTPSILVRDAYSPSVIRSVGTTAGGSHD